MNQSIRTIQEELGGRLRDERVRKSLTQAELSKQSNVAIKAIQALENGAGSTLHTVIAVMKALQLVDQLDLIAPRSSVSPMNLLKQSRRPGRVYLSRRVRHSKED